MGDLVFPRLDRDDWLNLAELCPDQKDQETLCKYINELQDEWQSLFGDDYLSKTIELSQMSHLKTGIARAGRNEYTHAATLTVILFDEDPRRYWSRITRYITVFFQSNGEVGTINKSSIQPKYVDTFYKRQPSVKN